jgi:hypothetical protein
LGRTGSEAIESFAAARHLPHDEREKTVGFENLGKTVQIAAAVLGIPAAAAGTYSAYQTYFTNDAVCQKLRTSIVAIMERNVAPEAKRTLLRKDVGDFVKTCGAADPDARILFQEALREDRPVAVAAAAPRPVSDLSPAKTAVATPDGIPTGLAAAFGRSPAGEVRGWVALTRGEPNRIGERNFEGYELSLTALPPPGTVLRPKLMLPVWVEPQGSVNDEKKLQGRVPATGCVRVISVKAAAGKARTWGEVAPVACPANLQAKAS